MCPVCALCGHQASCTLSSSTVHVRSGFCIWEMSGHVRLQISDADGARQRERDENRVEICSDATVHVRERLKVRNCAAECESGFRTSNPQSGLTP